MLEIVQSISIVVLVFLLYRLNKNIKNYSNIIQDVHIDIKGYEQLKEFEKQFAEHLRTINKVGTWKK